MQMNMNLINVQDCVSRDDTFNILNERQMYGVNLQYVCDSKINFCFSNINEREITNHKNRIKKAILMIGSCADAYYHFPVEYVSHLYDLRDCNLAEYKIVLLKSKRNDWQRMWIEMFLPECIDNIVILNKEDSVYFDYCISLGRFYSKPRDVPKNVALNKELNWMASIIRKKFNSNRCTYSKLLLIKRNNKRCLSNWDEVFLICKKYCTEVGLELDIFDDSKDLGSVKEQLKRFYTANIVIGSHGAGFANIIGCREKTYFCEFVGSGDLKCYRYIAKKLDLNYTFMSVNESGYVDVKSIKKYLESING